MTAQLQVVVRNGGRNGVALTAGFRWALGKEGKPIEKVNAPAKKLEASNNLTIPKKLSKQTLNEVTAADKNVQSEHKILKQMTTKQKAAFTRSNTTLTPKVAIVK